MPRFLVGSTGGPKVVSDVLEERSVVRACLVTVAVVLQVLTQLLAALSVLLTLLGEARVRTGLEGVSLTPGKKEVHCDVMQC